MPFRLLHRGKAVTLYEPAPGLEGIDAEALDATAEETIRRVSADLGIEPGAPLNVYLLPEVDALRTASAEPLLPPWAAGAAFGGSGDIVLVVTRVRAYPDQNLDGVLAHECAHVVLDRALSRSGVRAPRWFEEGFAVLESRPWGWGDALALVTTLLPSAPPPLSSFEEGFPEGASEAKQAYVVSTAFLTFLERRSGAGVVRRIARGMADGAPFDTALARETGRDLPSLEEEWRRSALIQYRWIPILTSSGAVWMLIMILLFIAGAKRRARRRELERVWEATGAGAAPGGPEDWGPS